MTSTKSSVSVMTKPFHGNYPCRVAHGSWAKKGSNFVLKATCPYCGERIAKKDLKVSVISGMPFQGYVKCDCGKRFYLSVTHA